MQSTHFAAAQQFTAVNTGLPQPPYPCVAWGDYDGDGDLDVLIAGEGKQGTTVTAIYKNTAGVFINSGVVLPLLESANAAWGDFDNDGDLDLAMIGLTTGGVTATRIYRNNGTTFTAVTGTFTGVYGGSLGWADYDGDGDLDLIVTGATATPSGSPPATRLYRNDAGTFTSVPHPFGNSYLGAMVWGDFDNDGDPDLLIAGSVSAAFAGAIWRNDGGTFTVATASLPNMRLGFAEWGDFDNDGDLDLLYGGDTDDGWVARIYRNDAGTFVNTDAALVGVIWAAAKWGDYDNDGDLDCIIVGYDPVNGINRSDLYRNDAGTFVNTGLALHDAFLGLTTWADFDNDGDLDLLIAGNSDGGDHLTLYRNNTVVVNAAPTAPANLTADVNGTSVVLTWDVASDGQTLAAGLNYNLRVGTTPGGSQIVAPLSSDTGYRRLTALGNAGPGFAVRLGALKPGTNYFWSVQAVDTAFAGSPFAAEGSFMALADPPSTGSIAREGLGSIRATWRGTPGSAYQVLSSTNLSAWSLFATPIAGTNGLFEIVDATGSAPAKFYRAARP